MKKVISIILAIMMVITCMPAVAFAEQEGDYVAQINDTGYLTLTAAFDAATDGSTIVMLKDISTGQINIADNNGDYSNYKYYGTRNITLDLNGCTITYSNSSGFTINTESVFRIQGGCTLNLIDSGTDGEIDAGSVLVYDLVKGTINISDGTYTSTGTLGNISGSNMCTANITGGLFNGGFFTKTSYYYSAQVIVSGGYYSAEPVLSENEIILGEGCEKKATDETDTTAGIDTDTYYWKVISSTSGVTHVTPTENESEGITQEVITAVTCNDSVNNFTGTNLSNAVTGIEGENLSIKFELKNAKGANDNDATLTYDVKPYNGENVIANDNLNGNLITIRLPLTDKFNNMKVVRITHKSEGYQDEIFYAQVNTEGKYVEIILRHFSEINIEGVPIAQIGDKKYYTLQEAFAAATGGTADKPIVVEVLVPELTGPAKNSSGKVVTDDIFKRIVVTTDAAWYKTARANDTGWPVIPEYVTLKEAEGVECTIKGTLELNGAQHFTIDGFTFDVGSAGKAYRYYNNGDQNIKGTDIACIVDNGIYGQAGAAYLTVKNCQFIGTPKEYCYAIAVDEQGRNGGTHAHSWIISNNSFHFNGEKNIGKYLHLHYLCSIDSETIITGNIFTVDEGKTFDAALSGTNLYGKLSFTNNSITGDYIEGVVLGTGGYTSPNSATLTITGNTFNCPNTSQAYQYSCDIAFYQCNSDSTVNGIGFYPEGVTVNVAGSTEELNPAVALNLMQNNTGLVSRAQCNTHSNNSWMLIKSNKAVILKQGKSIAFTNQQGLMDRVNISSLSGSVNATNGLGADTIWLNQDSNEDFNFANLNNPANVTFFVPTGVNYTGTISVPGGKDLLERVTENGIGYKIGSAVAKIKAGETDKFYETLQDAVDAATNDDIVYLLNNTGVESSTAEIDDTVKIVADEGYSITVNAAPGYKTNEPLTGGGKTTYTAIALDIGKDYQDGENGSGKIEAKKNDTKKVDATAAVVSSAVDEVVATVTQTDPVTDTNSIESVAKIVASNINQGLAAKALAKGTDLTIRNATTAATDIAAKDISVFVDTYYQTKVTEDKTTETVPAQQSFTLDIKPMYQAYATTVTINETTTVGSLMLGTDSAKIGEAKELDMTGKIVTMKVKLPAGFVSSTGDKVYVKHTKGATSHYYTATVIEEGTGSFFAVFTNPDGFSEFTFSRTSLEPAPPTPPAGGGSSSVPVKKACPQDETCVYAKYTDADTKEWYHDGVHFCVEKGYMIGVDTDRFAPAENLSRAMIVTMLWRIEGSPVVNYAMSFEDVADEQWYTEAVRWAQSTKIVEGYSSKAFGPEDNVTREQVATILNRYAVYKGISVSKTADLNKYTDAQTTSDWALDSIKWANAVGIINGRTDTTIVPGGESSRAEAACMFQRFCESILK